MPLTFRLCLPQVIFQAALSDPQVRRRQVSGGSGRPKSSRRSAGALATSLLPALKTLTSSLKVVLVLILRVGVEAGYNLLSRSQGVLGTLRDGTLLDLLHSGDHGVLPYSLWLQL